MEPNLHADFSWEGVAGQSAFSVAFLYWLLHTWVGTWRYPTEGSKIKDNERLNK